MSESSATFSIRLPDALRLEVDTYAKSTQRSRAFVIKEAVEAFIDERRHYLAAVEEALIEADKGEFISGEAAMDWLESWGTDDLKPAPKPDIFGQSKS